VNEHMFLGYLVAGLSLLLNLYLMARKASGRAEERIITPDPLNVAEHKPIHERFAPISHSHPQYIERGECPARHDKEEQRNKEQLADIKQSMTQIKNELAAHNVRAEERASLIHTRVNALLTPVAELTGRFNDHINARGIHKGAT
jgi:hypothetical protein